MTKKDNDELIGFRDFIEQENKKSPPTRRDNDNNYALITFLEKDAKRLENQILLYEEKVQMLKSYPQHEKIIDQLNSEHKDLEEEIIAKFLGNSKGFVNNLSEIFGNHFRRLSKD